MPWTANQDRAGCQPRAGWSGGKPLANSKARTSSVPKVTAHGMRGLHSTLALEAGVTGAVVAASLGHEDISTTIESYAKPEAVGARGNGGPLRS